jgi:arabinofuranosyltransferase
MSDRTAAPQHVPPWFARSPVWLTGVLLLYVAHVVYLNCVADDAFITFRFAKNLASGRGLVWNPGEAPVEGYTSFLWLVLSAVAMKLGLDAPRFAQVAGTLGGGATILLVYLAGRRLAGWPAGVAGVPALMLAVCGPFATWSGSGMETVLFAALVFTGMFAFGEYWQRGRAWWLAAMGVALWAATMTRPEGVMVFGLLFGLSLFLSLGELKKRLGHHAMAGACWGIPFAVYFVWRYRYYGYLLPNTFYAKTGGGLDQLERGIMLSTQFASQFLGPLVPWALVALWERGWPRVASLRLAEALGALRRRALASACVLIVVVYTGYIVIVGNDYMAMHRFFVPLLPPIYFVATTALAVLVPRMVAERSRVVVLGLLVAMAAGATAFHSTRYEKHFVAKPAQQHGNYQGIQIERWQVARVSLLGKFFTGYRLSSAESVATSAIGAIGYFGDLAVYDYHGLVDIHIARSPVPANKLKGRSGHQKSDYPYVLAKKPTYLMFSRELTKTPGDLQRFVPPDVWPLVQQDYVLRSVWLTDAVNQEAGYFTFLERRDHERLVGEAAPPH